MTLDSCHIEALNSTQNLFLQTVTYIDPALSSTLDLRHIRAPIMRLINKLTLRTHGMDLSLACVIQKGLISNSL